jgi:hypothetical protein
MEGFENYLTDEEISDLSHYLCNLDNNSEYVAICSRYIKNVRQDQIEGWNGWIYNPSITQRINNLKESTDITSGGTKFKQD